MNFQAELNEKGHFYTSYASIEDLKFKFGEQLAKCLGSRGFNKSTVLTSHPTLREDKANDYAEDSVVSVSDG